MNRLIQLIPSLGGFPLVSKIRIAEVQQCKQKWRFMWFLKYVFRAFDEEKLFYAVEKGCNAQCINREQILFSIYKCFYLDDNEYMNIHCNKVEIFVICVKIMMECFMEHLQHRGYVLVCCSVRQCTFLNEGKNEKCWRRS